MGDNVYDEDWIYNGPLCKGIKLCRNRHECEKNCPNERELYNKYKDVCDRVWNLDCKTIKNFTSEEIEKILKDIEDCGKLRCEYNKSCCGSTGDRGHLLAIQRMEEKLANCRKILGMGELSEKIPIIPTRQQYKKQTKKQPNKKQPNKKQNDRYIPPEPKKQIQPVIVPEVTQFLPEENINIKNIINEYEKMMNELDEINKNIINDFPTKENIIKYSNILSLYENDREELKIIFNDLISHLNENINRGFISLQNMETKYNRK